MRNKGGLNTWKENELTLGAGESARKGGEGHGRRHSAQESNSTASQHKLAAVSKRKLQESPLTVRQPTPSAANTPPRPPRLQEPN